MKTVITRIDQLSSIDVSTVSDTRSWREVLADISSRVLALHEAEGSGYTWHSMDISVDHGRRSGSTNDTDSSERDGLEEASPCSGSRIC